MNILGFFPNLALVEFRTSGIPIKRGLGILTFCSLPKSISEEMDFAELYLLASNVEVVVFRVSGLFILKYRIEARFRTIFYNKKGNNFFRW